MNATAIPFFLLASYLIGSIPFGYLIARWRGIDIFQHGSGNIGATNIGRVLGKRFGVLVFLLDFAKGAGPAAAGLQLGGSLSQELGVAAGLAAFLGHLFPVFLRFRGGKGVATGAGVVAVLVPGPAVGALIVWLAVVAVSRHVSLASLTAATALCVLRLALTDNPFAPDNRVLTAFCCIAAALVFLRHRSNIGRLLRGTENQMPETTTMLLAKTLHVLALGLWFGASIFFSLIVAPSLFRTFEALAVRPAADRPVWYPVGTQFDRDEGTRKEQGTRTAGEAISPLFDYFFLLQGVCGFVAVLTALAWWNSGETVHKVRGVLLILALLTVVVGWPLEKKVSSLRLQRNQARDAVLVAGDGVSESVKAEGEETSKQFGRYHVYSLLLNFVTLILVIGAMALAGNLPTAAAAEKKAASEPVQTASRTP